MATRTISTSTVGYDSGDSQEVGNEELFHQQVRGAYAVHLIFHLISRLGGLGCTLLISSHQ